MSRSYWRIILAIVGILILSGSTYGTYQLYKSAEQQHSKYDYQPARDPRFVQIVPSKAKPKGYEPDCQNPQGNSNADLCAQWAAVDQVTESNRMSSLNLRFAIISMALTVIGTGLLVWTLVETRHTSRRELRAYVFSDSVGIYILKEQKPASENGKVGSTIHVKNSGSTPAYNLRHQCILALHSVVDEAELQIASLEPHFASTMPVPPGGAIHAFRRLPRKITKQQIADLNAGTLAFYVYGRIQYTDAFDMPHFTNYRFAYSGWPLTENLTMNFAVIGNEAN